jgi:hydrogenase maturation protease
LLEILAGYSSVILVDASFSDDPPGIWRRIDALAEALPFEKPQASTHGFSLAQTIELAKTLHQLPASLIIYAITGQSFHMGSSLSAPIEKATRQVAQAIMREICMKNT